MIKKMYIINFLALLGLLIGISTTVQAQVQGCCQVADCGGQGDTGCWCDGICSGFGDCCDGSTCVGTGGAGGGICGDGVTQCDADGNSCIEIILPAELISFTAVSKQEFNTLYWSTATEINTEWFVVEYSRNGVSGWTEKDRVSAVGYSTEQQNYSYTDKVPHDLNYYRLRIQDFDGSVEYSEIVYLQNKGLNASSMRLFPNPVVNEIQVKFDSHGGKAVQLSIVDLKGNQVINQSIDTDKGMNFRSIDVSELLTGSYFLIVDEPNGTTKKQFYKN